MMNNSENGLYQFSSKKEVRYTQCLKNHAAAIGGNAVDGCGEFMPSGQAGTLEALICSACGCHRNFHKKELQCHCSSEYFLHAPLVLPRGDAVSTQLILAHNNCTTGPESVMYTPNKGVLLRPIPPTRHQLLISRTSRGSSGLASEEFDEGDRVYETPVIGIGMFGDCQIKTTLLPQHTERLFPRLEPVMPQHEDQEDNNGRGRGGIMPIMARCPTTGEVSATKRFRTKFSKEQKEKMLKFAENTEWRIQKQDDSVVQQFCREIGIERRVLKVWMHNNKHNLANKCKLQALDN